MDIRIWEKEIENQLIQVHLIPILKSNYVFILSWEKQALIVDPGNAEPVLEYIEQNAFEVKAILNTHHHEDHIAGNRELKEKTGACIIGPSDVHIENMDQVVSDGEEIILGPLLIQVMSTPGHTLDHLCYYIPDYGILFAGDLLFSAGCGRIFEGTCQVMYNSIEKVAQLPDDTVLFGAHEYTLNNLKFAKSVEPNNRAIDIRIEEIVEHHTPGVPSTLDMEKKTNPFLRTSSEAIRKTLNMTDADDVDVFCKLREMKDQFVS